MPDTPKHLKRGRKSTYDEAIASEILQELAEGNTLRQICRDNEDYPHESTVRSWALDNIHDFGTRYMRARALQMQAYEDKIVEIANDSSKDTIQTIDGELENREWVNRSKVKIDALKFIMSKVGHKIYGDKIEATVLGDAERPLVFKLKLGEERKDS